MSMSGIVFDIQEFSVNDGPGLRMTVFLKGCPLRCRWCHNPEGLSSVPETNLLTGRVVGRKWSEEDLLDYLLLFKDVFDMSGGGVTFSGGEATAQPDFLIAVARGLRLRGIHVNLETCGYCPAEIFSQVLRQVDLVYYDLKCMDPILHKKMTGVDNALILANAHLLSESKIPYRVRIPLIPGVAETPENQQATKDFVASLPNAPLGIDWLPFNELAASKYSAYGLTYNFAENFRFYE